MFLLSKRMTSRWLNDEEPTYSVSMEVKITGAGGVSVSGTYTEFAVLGRNYTACSNITISNYEISSSGTSGTSLAADPGIFRSRRCY